MSTRRMNNHFEMLEQGDIFLLDWPELKNYESEEVEQTQPFYLLMHPMGWPHHRLIHLSKKSLGKSDRGGAHYSGVVDEIVRSDRNLSDHFADATRETRKCTHPPLTLMRLVGMGEYQLVRDGNHTELAYELVSPQHCNDLEHDSGISPSATYIIGVKNLLPTPRQSNPKNQQRAAATQSLQECYSSYGFLNADPLVLLNLEGAEVLLIRADNVEKR